MKATHYLMILNALYANTEQWILNADKAGLVIFYSTLYSINVVTGVGSRIV